MQKLSISIFTAMLAGSMLLTAGAKKPDAAKGKEVFEQCGACHNADSTEKKMGPGLKGISKKAGMTDAKISGKIDAGGNGMPAYKEMLSADEKADVMAYLKTL